MHILLLVLKIWGVLMLLALVLLWLWKPLRH